MIRFFCYVMDAGENRLADLAFDYMCGFAKLKQKVRVIPIGLADFDPKNHGRWFEYRDFFSVPIDCAYINVVCGGPFELHRFHTSGVQNIGISAVDGAIQEADQENFRRYDRLILHYETRTDHGFLPRLDLITAMVPPEQLH